MASQCVIGAHVAPGEIITRECYDGLTDDERYYLGVLMQASRGVGEHADRARRDLLTMCQGLMVRHRRGLHEAIDWTR